VQIVATDLVSGEAVIISEGLDNKPAVSNSSNPNPGSTAMLQ
jgi:hypothetical protein